MSKSYYNPFIKSCSTLLEFLLQSCSRSRFSIACLSSHFKWMLIKSTSRQSTSLQPLAHQRLSSCPVHMQADGVGSITPTYSLLLFLVVYVVNDTNSEVGGWGCKNQSKEQIGGEIVKLICFSKVLDFSRAEQKHFKTHVSFSQ